MNAALMFFFGWRCKDDHTPSAAAAAVVEYDDDECTIVPVGLLQTEWFLDA